MTRFSRNILRIAWSNVYGLVALLKSSFEYARLRFFKIKVRHCYMDHSANRPRRNYTRLPGAMHCLGSNCVIDSTNASFANNSARGNGGKTRRRAQVCTGNSVRKPHVFFGDGYPRQAKDACKPYVYSKTSCRPTIIIYSEATLETTRFLSTRNMSSLKSEIHSVCLTALCRCY